MRQFHNVRSRITGLAFTADGKTLFACARGKWDVPVWNLETGTFQLMDLDLDGPVRCIATSPDGKWLAVGNEAGQLLAHEHPTWAQKQDFSLGGNAPPGIHGVAFGWTQDRSDCRIAFAAGKLYAAKMKGTEDAESIPIPHTAVALAFSPDGQFVAALDECYYAIQIWNAWTGEAVTHNGSANEPRSVCFTADGRTVAVAVASRIELWDADVLGDYVALKHGGRVTQVAGHPTRNLIASASTDGTVRFWNTDSKQEERTYNWNIGKVTAVCFSPDGLTCAAGGEKGQVVVWDVDG